MSFPLNLQEYLKEQREKKQRLSTKYTQKSIKLINIKQLNKFTYIMGIKYVSGKREIIDKIIKRQNDKNPIIILQNENYVFNKNVDFWEYINKI